MKFNRQQNMIIWDLLVKTQADFAERKFKNSFRYKKLELAAFKKALRLKAYFFAKTSNRNLKIPLEPFKCVSNTTIVDPD